MKALTACAVGRQACRRVEQCSKRVAIPMVAPTRMGRGGDAMNLSALEVLEPQEHLGQQGGLTSHVYLLSFLEKNPLK